MKGKPGDYSSIIGAGPSLELFLSSLAEFDHKFCDHMAEGNDFNLKLEVHGNKSEICYVRVLSDGFKRPDGYEKKLEEKKRK